jgi:hypothetical protein
VCGSKTTAMMASNFREVYAEHSGPLGPRCAASDRPVTVVTPADGIERALLAASEQLHRVRFERGLAERMTASARARNRTITTAILCAVFALAGLAAGLALRDRKPASVAPSEAQRVPRRVDARVFLTPDAGPVQ